MFPYLPAKRLQKLRGTSKSTVAPTLKFNIFPDQQKKSLTLPTLKKPEKPTKRKNNNNNRKVWLFVFAPTQKSI
jgi:hypothetical protein